MSTTLIFSGFLGKNSESKKMLIDQFRLYLCYEITVSSKIDTPFQLVLLILVEIAQTNEGWVQKK